MSIRIYSKKAFAIGPGASRTGGEPESFITVPGAFQDMPEKYVNDPTYKLAVRCGDIVPYQAAPSVSVGSIENATFEDANDSSDEVDVVDLVNKFYGELKGKNKEETKELAEKYGAEYDDNDKLSNNKKRVLEAYKLFVNKDEDNEE